MSLLMEDNDRYVFRCSNKGDKRGEMFITDLIMGENCSSSGWWGGYWALFNG